MEFPATTASSHVLSNGLTVILDADSSAPVISTQAWVETGSIHEGRHLGAGLSHLLEHMVFKGTENYDGKEISDTVQAAGGEWNAYTTFDRTVYYIDGPSESAQTFLKVLTEMVFKPSFPI
ncbi:MAG: insulinase family protein, partial [Verrucomicrobiaceae bacterium]|nr:insulinase family protein [Verrucomicrobiaceae bacterium]